MTEVILQEIVFSNNKTLTLSLAIEEYMERNILRWVIASEGRSNNPVVFFGDSDLKVFLEINQKCEEINVS